MIGPFLQLGAVMAGMFILQAGNGLLATFLALRMTIEQFPTPVIGLVASGYPLGFLVSCLVAGRLIRAVGHIRAFAALAAVQCCATLAFTLFAHPAWWLPLRFVTGLSAAGLFMVGESWLNQRTPTAVRGKVFATYMISNMTAVSGSQLLLGLADPTGPAFFMIAAALFSACLIPVALTRASAPTLPHVSALTLTRLYRVSPLAVVGCISAGLVNAALGNVGAVYATLIGLAPATVGVFMAVLMLGGLLLQWPIGRLSDRLDRRHVLLGVTLSMLALALVIASLGGQSRYVLVGLAALYGGLAYAVYPLCVTHASDHADRSQMVSVSSGLLLSWSAGAIAGPPFATLAMSAIGAPGLFFYGASVSLCLSTFILWRMTRRGPVPAEQAAPFVAQRETTPVAAGLDPRAET